MVSPQGRIRIIGGEWRSRIIVFPDCVDLRPTPDRVRETLFNWLGQDLHGKICLDLFAGSGILGFEAASRGAKHVVMVESDAKIFDALQENKNKLGATSVELVRMNALEFKQINSRKFDCIFLDPPYRLGLLPELLEVLPSYLAKNGQVYIEASEKIIPGQQWVVRRSGRAGKVCYHLLQLKADE